MNWNPSNAIHRSRGLEWLSTESVLQIEARQGAEQFEYFKPLKELTVYSEQESRTQARVDWTQTYSEHVNHL